MIYKTIINGEEYVFGHDYIEFDSLDYFTVLTVKQMDELYDKLQEEGDYEMLDDWQYIVCDGICYSVLGFHNDDKENCFAARMPVFVDPDDFDSPEAVKAHALRFLKIGNNIQIECSMNEKELYLNIAKELASQVDGFEAKMGIYPEIVKVEE